jgi:Queuosine biosynthesis protein QueC
MIAENGQMAIHLPLSAARMGAFSTHTAHPEFVTRATEFFSGVLQHPIKLVNPYLNQTKAEVVAKLSREHQEAIPRSISCWKSARVHGHCGQCIPCYIRRIALEYYDLKVDKWDRDMFGEPVGSLPSTHEGKRNLSELAMFAKNFRELPEAELDIEYIQLYNKHFDRDQAAEMYRRFANEALTVMERYPALSHLL